MTIDDKSRDEKPHDINREAAKIPLIPLKEMFWRSKKETS